MKISLNTTAIRMYSTLCAYGGSQQFSSVLQCTVTFVDFFFFLQKRHIIQEEFGINIAPWCVNVCLLLSVPPLFRVPMKQQLDCYLLWPILRTSCKNRQQERGLSRILISICSSQ